MDDEVGGLGPQGDTGSWHPAMRPNSSTLEDLRHAPDLALSKQASVHPKPSNEEYEPYPILSADQEAGEKGAKGEPDDSQTRLPKVIATPAKDPVLGTDGLDLPRVNAIADEDGLPRNLPTTPFVSGWQEPESAPVADIDPQAGPNHSIDVAMKEAEAKDASKEGQVPSDWNAFDREEDVDYASIFKRTNSFPDVPPPQESTLQSSTLPPSQVQALLGEEEALNDESVPSVPDLLKHHEAHKDKIISNTGDFEQEADFFTSMGQQQESQTPAHPTEDEARFEEGLPLVQSENLQQHHSSAEEDQTRRPKNQDPGESFSGTESFEESFLASKPPDRISTSQILDSMYAPPSEPHSRSEDIEDRPTLDHLTGGGIAVSAHTVKSQILAENVDLETSKPQEDDLAEMWKAALGDDELLDENEVSVDPSSFFEDDGEGFLDETAGDAPTILAGSVTATSSSTLEPSYGADGKIQGFSRAKHEVSEVQSRYTPSSNIQTRQTESVQTYPDRNLAAQRSQASAAGRGLSGSTSTPAMGPYGYEPQPYTNGPLQAEKRPTVQSTQSFADKAKGGYTSPYDLPMDISRPKKRSQFQQPSLHPNSGLDTRPAPPRSSSMFTGAPPHSEPSASIPSMADIPPNAPNQGLAKSAAKLKPTSNTFFEDLPAVKSRPATSGGKYTPPMAQPVPPPHVPPQQEASRGGPPMQPSSQQPNATAQQQYQLLPPERMSLFGNSPSEQASVQPPPAVTSRYSPAPSQTSSGPPPRHRYAASPMATAQPPAPTPNMPFQPRTSSPLAQSSRQVNVADNKAPSYPAMNTQRTQSMSRANGHPIPSINQNEQLSLGSAQVGALTSSPPLMNSRSVPLSDSPSSSSQAIHTPETDHLSSEGPSNYHSPYDPASQIVASQNRAPPRRSQTQSPSATRPIQDYPPNKHVQLPRPASVNEHTNMIDSHSAAARHPQSGPIRGRGDSQSVEYIRPSDGREQDPLERWKGCPIVTFGFGGNVITSFPKQIPRYAAGQKTPVIKCSAGEIILRNAQIFAPEDRISSFPGPLKGKSKKKEVLEWLQQKISLFEAMQITPDHGNILPNPVRRHEEKTILWKVVKALVECDGNLESSEFNQTVRAILVPELNMGDAAMVPQEGINSPVGIVERTGSKSLAEQTNQVSMESIRKALLRGDREKAVWVAVDNRMWAHAMLLSSTLDKSVWKQVSSEFVRQEVKAFGDNTESLAALYQVLAGNADESMDELVPPSARAGLQMVSKVAATGPTKNALDGLDRWQETLTLILSNRAADDGQALVSLGQLLASYGRTEAAHTCLIFAKIPGVFGGPDDSQASICLLGGDHLRQPFDYGRDLDSILLTEVFDFARTILASSSAATISPHLQSYKLYHAMVLAESGSKAEAQQYCDAIANALKSTTKPSPYYHSLLFGALDNLGERLRQTPKDGSGSWISKPSIDKVSGTIWAKFNSYVAGDENDAASTTSGLPQDVDAGPFARVVGDSPNLSRRPSTAELYNPQAQGLALAPAANAVPTSMNARYAPTGLYTPRSSLEDPRRSSHDSLRPASNGINRGSYTPQPTSYQPTPSTESYESAYKTTAQAGPYTPNSGPLLPTPPAQSDKFLGDPQQDELVSSDVDQQYLSSIPPAQNAYNLPETHSSFDSPYEPYGPSTHHESSAAYEPHVDGSQRPTVSEPYSSAYQPSGVSSMPSSTYEPPEAGGYTPSSYEPPSYEPPSYNPDIPQNDDGASADERKKPSIMDDDDQDFEARAAAMRKEEKARKDREANEAFRKAAEEDGKFRRVFQFKSPTLGVR